MTELFSLLIGYLCGCFLTADVVARAFAHRSVFQIGTGNPGMANVMARVGKKAGFLVLAGDILKTLLAFLITGLLFGKGMSDSVLWSGLGVLLGHNWPFWHGFKGGKGVTVTCTWLIIAIPVWGALSCIAGGAVVLISGYLPLGAIVLAWLGTVSAFVTRGAEAGIFFAAAALIMTVRHFPGLRGMARGTEPRHFHHPHSHS